MLYDEKGRLIVSIPFAALESLPDILYQLSQLSDPDEDAILAWDDSAGTFVFQPAGSANDQIFHGYVDSSASAEDVPSGWSVTNPATGNYVVTHNLGLSSPYTDLRVVATPVEGEDTGVRPTIIDLGANSFDVHIDSDAGDANLAFFFIAILKGA